MMLLNQKTALKELDKYYQAVSYFHSKPDAVINWIFCVRYARDAIIISFSQGVVDVGCDVGWIDCEFIPFIVDRDDDIGNDDGSMVFYFKKRMHQKTLYTELK